MKTFRTAIIFGTLLGAAGAASAQINMPTPGSPGSSPDYAVRIVATSDLMVDRFIARWLRAHYPGWDADPHEFMEIGPDRYAVVYITSPNNPGRRIYFKVQSRMNDPDDSSSPFPL
jgi:hypothetical protein